MSKLEKVVLCSGLEVEVVEGDDQKDVQESTSYTKAGFIKPADENWILPKPFLKYDEPIYNFPLKPTDIIVNGFLKSGTTWVQELAWTIANNPDLDNPLQKENVNMKAPFFELDSLQYFENEHIFRMLSSTYNIPIKESFLEMYKDIPAPRIFKTHLYPSVINHDMLNISKMIYVIRNPLDTCYSFYLFHQFIPGIMGLNKGWDEYADTFIKGELLGGNSAEHISKWWPYRNHKNFHMILYENIKKDPVAEIRKMANFLEKELSEDQIQNVLHQTSFKQMKSVFSETEAKFFENIQLKITDEQSSFFRKGTVGDSKNMPKDAYNKISAYCKEKLKNIDLPYTFDLK